MARAFVLVALCLFVCAAHAAKSSRYSSRQYEKIYFRAQSCLKLTEDWGQYDSAALPCFNDATWKVMDGAAKEEVPDMINDCLKGSVSEKERIAVYECEKKQMALDV